MLSREANSGNQSFEPSADKGCCEPDPAILFLCCVRSQREKCGMSEKLHAFAQQNNRPFVQVAAWIKRRTYRSRTKCAFAVAAPMVACRRKATCTEPMRLINLTASSGPNCTQYQSLHYRQTVSQPASVRSGQVQALFERDMRPRGSWQARMPSVFPLICFVSR